MVSNAEVIDQLLDGMTYPIRRRTDYAWLYRNIGIWNLDHANLPVLMLALRKELQVR